MIDQLAAELERLSVGQPKRFVDLEVVAADARDPSRGIGGVEAKLKLVVVVAAGGGHFREEATERLIPAQRRGAVTPPDTEVFAGLREPVASGVGGEHHRAREAHPNVQLGIDVIEEGGVPIEAGVVRQPEEGIGIGPSAGEHVAAASVGKRSFDHGPAGEQSNRCVAGKLPRIALALTHIHHAR